jgi:ribonucleoside-triphosphate reductase
VSLTGQMDNLALYKGEISLENLKKIAIDVNKEYADILGINQSTAISCTKPSGTVSQLVDSASGLHTRHSEYYIRSVRADNKDPLTQFLKESGIPYEPEVNKPEQTTVFYFPIKSPDGAMTRDSLTAIEQLEYWKKVQEEWCEHKPSITVTVKEHEWPEVGGWVYKNFDIVSGVSFLPHSEHSYRQAPYEAVDEVKYNELKDKMPKEIRWEDLSYYELEDHTTGMQTLACSAGDSCEVVDIQ